jgi:hypothetical protein
MSPGSRVQTPPGALSLFNVYSAVVQWLGYLAFTQETRVQTPAAELFGSGRIAQSVERRSDKAKALGSSPSVTILLLW